jgi:hypothetical protein
MSDLVITGREPAAVLALANRKGFGQTALAIVAAWYTGSIGTGVSALAVSYADALMNRTVSDALAPPTYQLGGPGWWTAPPPDADKLPRAAFNGLDTRGGSAKHDAS